VVAVTGNISNQDNENVTICRFQVFDEPTDPMTVGPRVAQLREELMRQSLQGFIVPRADQHQGEYVPDCDARLAFVTGFTGSAGAAVILLEKAALIVDGRYTIQSAAQTDVDVVTPVKMEETSLESWIAANLPAGSRLGFDPWLHTPGQVERLKAAATKAGGELAAVTQNPVDAIWQDRPPAPAAPLTVHPAHLAGEPAAGKIARIQMALAKAQMDALVVSDPHNLMWIFNLRGGDVGHTPIALGYGIIPVEGRPTLFFSAERFGPEVTEYLSALADLADPVSLAKALVALGSAKAKVRLDAATAASALAGLIEQAGGTSHVGSDPASLMKAQKNDAERQGARQAHLVDGAAMARFLAWLSVEAPKGHLTEISAAARLEDERIATGMLKEISFPSISAAGPNAALPHYRVSHASNRRLDQGIYLIDSGGQYECGTTDITRTVVIGEPTGEMRDRYTRVLKGHIAISRLVFPKGVSGAQLDAFARLPLWQAGLDFDHGTGHGVGSYLSVHEGPQRLSKLGTIPLEPGMILSNEPGYYKPGDYGIRIENLVIVEAKEMPGAEREMLGFETITFCPYDRALIDLSLLDAGETGWINAYHDQVLAKIGPLVSGEVLAWLKRACARL
jgi:Xaa-Pro aminopeptidase